MLAGVPCNETISGVRDSGADEGVHGPGEIRTHDLLLRRQALYPAELRALFGEAKGADGDGFWQPGQDGDQ